MAREGFSPGDYFLESDALRRPASGARVGRVIVKATVVKLFRRPQDGLFIADFTAGLANGRISGYGHGRFSQFRTGLKFAVTGGTGAYNDARGAVLVRNGRCGGKPGTRITFNLTG